MYKIHMLKLSNYVTLDLHDFKDDAWKQVQYKAALGLGRLEPGYRKFQVGCPQKRNTEM